MITILAVDGDAPPRHLEAVRTLMMEYAALPQPFVAPRGALLLATGETEALGCGALLTLEAGVGEIKRMYVRPAARGQGVGTALLHALLSQAALQGFVRVRLDTAPELLEAQALYRRFRFAPIPPYRPGLLPDALCFELPVPQPKD